MYPTPRSSLQLSVGILCMGLAGSAWAAPKTPKAAAKASPTPAAAKETAKPNPHAVKVKMTTSMGVIRLELDPDKAPITVKNFVDYAQSGHYNGTVFHRVMLDFMIQGGGFDAKMKEKSAKAPIKNEASNGLKNDRGTIAMARTDDPDSAAAQFFINQADNAFLNHSSGNPGYAVFGKVVEGMEVVDKIAQVKVGNFGFHQNVPVKPVTIETVTIEK